MNLKEEFAFLRSLDLNVTLLFRNYKKSQKGQKNYNIFVIVSKRDGDKLHYRDTSLEEEDRNRLKNWIRCGDPTGLTAEWREVYVGDSKWRAYLAGERQEIDCSSVLDEIFVNDNGEKYTYYYGQKNEWIKTTHPEDQIRLSNFYYPFVSWRS